VVDAISTTGITADQLNIEKYVAMEPNLYFKEERTRHSWIVIFPLDFVDIKGEDVDTPPDEYYRLFDVVIMTNVLCSVNSVESVLANADWALKPGVRIIFMEHDVVADRGSLMWYGHGALAPILNIVGNGYEFRNLRYDIENYLGNRFKMLMLKNLTLSCQHSYFLSGRILRGLLPRNEEIIMF
jgi:hypothetical protein